MSFDKEAVDLEDPPHSAKPKVSPVNRVRLEAEKPPMMDNQEESKVQNCEQFSGNIQSEMSIGDEGMNIMSIPAMQVLSTKQ